MSRLLVRNASYHRWIRFAAMASVVIFLIAFRPISSIQSSNDTGRYVSEMEDYCSRGEITDTEGFFREDGYSLMYEITGSCLFGSYRLFLFLAALTVPATYLCFCNWKRGDGLIASSAMFSVSGIEFMSNALRNGFAIFFFMGALKIAQTRLFLSAAIFAFALLLHSSIFVFFPILYFVWLGATNHRHANLMGFVLAIMFGLQTFFSNAGFEEAILSVFELGVQYSIIYDIDTNGMFTLFMVAPLPAIFLVRFRLDRSSLTTLEFVSFIYSSLLLTLIYSFFPFITFRFAIMSVALQLFAITLAGSRSMNANRLILALSITHLVIMLAASSNYEFLWE